ncbi:MAG: hypothetical protein QF521_15915, partial [Alphaproteobacteria bacterium]|jgi:hypothetical protein|nr:hypothetical protein [Alphaproteobacteria bacterium]
MAKESEIQLQQRQTGAHVLRSAEDWETLFEDPENGLITLIGQAHSVDALVRSTSSLLRKLYQSSQLLTLMAGFHELAGVILLTT